MEKYFDNISDELKSYFHILSNDIPDFLSEYVNTPRMYKQAGISVSCGTYYSNMYDIKWYSSLDHSVAVALIIWHFTRDKKQTLAGLFHDIATPCFKHTIDFMNGDYETQESTEALTEKLITGSPKIMRLLERDGIKVEEVSDYHIYPIADNDTPKLSSDRLEYTLSNGNGVTMWLWDLDEIKEVYDNIEIQVNEEGIQELGFKDVEIAKKFINNMKRLSGNYIQDKTRFTMQFLADIMKRLNDKKLISIDDLYQLSEKEVIDIIENCGDEEITNNFKKWKNASGIKRSEEPIENTYCAKVPKSKIRYINPLVKYNDGFKRVSDVSEEAEQIIKDVQHQKIYKHFIYLDSNL